MLGEAVPGVNLNSPQERGKKPIVWMLREPLQRVLVRRRAVGRGRRGSTWAAGCRVRCPEGAGRAEGRGLQAAGGVS